MASKGPKKALIAVLVIILAAIVVYAAVMAVSISRVMDSYSQARQSYESARTSISEGDFVAAYSSARSTLDSLSDLSDELEGVQWSIAAALPIVGDDVRVARELADVGGLLIDEAALPTLDQLESMWGEDFLVIAAGALAGDEEAMTGLSERLGEASGTLNHATDVVYECERRLNALPESHIDKINDAASTLREAVSTMADLLRVADQIAYGM